MIKKIKIIFLLITGGFFIWPNFVFGTAGNVVINEICWMGTTENWRYEWLELYNNTDQSIPLDGWKIELYRDDLDFTIDLSGTIENYFLVVASDAIFANYDFNYSNLGGKVNNNGQRIVLKNNQGSIVDEIDCFSSGEGWLAGNNSTKQTAERITSGWQTSLNPGGTPKAQNSKGEEIPPEETPEEESEEPPIEEPPIEESNDEESTPPTAVNQPPIADAGIDITALVNQKISFDGSLSYDPDNDTLTFFWNFGDGATDTKEKSFHIYTYPGQYIVSLLVNDDEFSDLDIITVNIYNDSIIISEFLPDPEETDTENEWIELFNQSDKIANLTNWQIDDQEGGSSPFIFPENSLIAPGQFLVLRRPITKIALDNDKDQVRLIYPNGSLSSQINYEDTQQGFSIAFDNNDYFWTKIPTPGSANIISSTDWDSPDKNISSNNPQPNIEQSQNFAALSPKSDSNEQFSNETSETASLINSSQSAKKSNLILTLSIIISGSILASWLLIRLKRK